MLIDLVSKKKKEQYIDNWLKHYNAYCYYKDYDPPIKFIDFDKETTETLEKYGYIDFLKNLEIKNVFVKLIEDVQSTGVGTYPIYYCKVFIFNDFDMETISPIVDYDEKDKTIAMLKAINAIKTKFPNIEQEGSKRLNKTYLNEFLLANSKKNSLEK